MYDTVAKCKAKCVSLTLDCVAYQFKAAVSAPPTSVAAAVCKTFNTADKLLKGDSDGNKGKCYIIPFNPNASDVDGGLIGRCVMSTGSEIISSHTHQHADIITLSSCLAACLARVNGAGTGCSAYEFGRDLQKNYICKTFVVPSSTPIVSNGYS